jgi:hypothetical protein
VQKSRFYLSNVRTPARHPFVRPVGMNSPRCEDLKTIDFQLEETFLLRADSFWIPRNIDVRNPFFPFQAVRAGIRN